MCKTRQNGRYNICDSLVNCSRLSWPQTPTVAKNEKNKFAKTENLIKIYEKYIIIFSLYALVLNKIVFLSFSELYFLISKFLSAGPLKETAQVNDC